MATKPINITAHIDAEIFQQEGVDRVRLDGETLTVYEYRPSPEAPPILVVPYGKLFFSVGRRPSGTEVGQANSVPVGTPSCASSAEPSVQTLRPALDIDTLLKENTATMIKCQEALKKHVKEAIQQERELAIERLDQLESLLLESITTTFSFAHQQQTKLSNSAAASPAVPRAKTLSRPPSSVFRTSTTPTDDWEMTPEQLTMYQTVFQNADVEKAGNLDGAKVAEILSKSELPKPVLAKIWALSSLNQENRLTLTEFCIAMHLTMKCRSGIALPDSLPEALRPQTQST